MIGEYGKEVETSTSLNVLHERLVELSEEYLHYDIEDDYVDFEGFSDYARTCLVEVPGQVARYLNNLSYETDDERLSALAADINRYVQERDANRTLAAKAMTCIDSSRAVNSPAPRPLPARLAVERS